MVNTSADSEDNDLNQYECTRNTRVANLSDKVWHKIQTLNKNINNCDTILDNNISSDNKLINSMTQVNNNCSEKTIEDLIDWNNLQIGNSFSVNFRRSLNVLFRDAYGLRVICIDNDDNVFSFGYNTYGLLGLGDTTNRMTAPVLNTTLSGKQVRDICIGYAHYVVRTKSGQCFAWGGNKYGQLGIGTFSNQCTPQLIAGLTHKKVVQICCGYDHSMALTSDTELFAWGRNTFGQLGDGTYRCSVLPIKIYIDKVISINSGRLHSLALNDAGQVYVWGMNEDGQLGRHYNCDIRDGRDKAMCNTPSLVNGLNCVIKKAVCGRDHTLLLTEDGHVYAFGRNDYGQVGNGSTISQFKPVCLNIRIKFKDIISENGNNLSLAISEDNQYYIWGLAQNKSALKPTLITISNERSIFDIYLKYVKFKTLFKTIIVTEDKYHIESKKSPDSGNFGFGSGQKQNNNSGINLEENKSFFKCSDSSSASIDNDSVRTSNALANCAAQAFNNPNNSNLKFVCEDKVIYCQKGFIKFRNYKFWLKMKQKVNDNKIVVDSYRFEAIHQFLKYLHGLEPEPNDRTVFQLQSMATNFDEKQLMNRCFEYIRYLEKITSDFRKSFNFS